MIKKTVYGELCPDDCDYCIEWCVDVELEDEQADDLLNLAFFAGFAFLTAAVVFSAVLLTACNVFPEWITGPGE